MSPCRPPPSNRAMAHYDCEVKAVLGQAVIFLKSPEERDNIVAILIITEVSPFRPCLTSTLTSALWPSGQRMDFHPYP